MESDPSILSVDLFLDTIHVHHHDEVKMESPGDQVNDAKIAVKAERDKPLKVRD